MVFTRFKFMPLIPAALFSAAFGFYLNDRLAMFEEMINNIYGMNERGAILWVVLLLLGLNLVSVLGSIVAAFSSREKA